MKSKTSLALAILVFLLFILSVFFRRLRNVKIHGIKSFVFSYTSESFGGVGKSLKLSIQGGGYMITVKMGDISDDNAVTVKVDKSFTDSLEAVLNRYKVYHWDRFDKADRRILNGNSFSLEVYDESGCAVSARGYEKWPRHFEDIKNEVETLFTRATEHTAISLKS